MKIVNTETLGVPSHPDMLQPAVFRAVLTQDDAGKFACYVGIVPADQSSASYSYWIAAMGAKQTWKNATAYFPNIKQEEYRA